MTPGRFDLLGSQDSILVTGGAGFIGSNFVRQILEARRTLRVATLDKLTYAGDRRNLEGLPDPSRHRFVEGDIGDSGQVRELLRDSPVRAIVNLAAETHVDRSLHQPAVFLDTNLRSVHSLLECARQVWIEDRGWGEGDCVFIQVSTDEVYGSLPLAEAPAVPGRAYRPTSPYAATKAGADHLARAWWHTYGLPSIVTNCTNNYGPFQHPEKLIPLCITNALRGDELPIYCDGQHVRDWIHVSDHVRGLLLTLEHGHPGETYHFASGVGTTNLDLVHRICRGLDRRWPPPEGVARASLIQLVADRPGHDLRYGLDTESTRRELGWAPAI